MNRGSGMSMNRRAFALTVVLAFLLSTIPLTEGNSNGIYNQSGGCSCHSQSGSSAATVSLTGLPTQYTAGTTSTLTISVTNGVSGSDGGFSLEVSHGTLSYMGFAVNVNSAGNSATHSITGSSYRTWSLDWTAPSSGTGTVTVAVAGLTANGNGQYSGDRWDTLSLQVPESGGAVNTEPSVSNLLLGPNGATTSSQLTLSYTFSDADGDAESGTVIQWYKDGVEQTALSGMTLASSFTAKNQQWYAVVTPSDGTDSGAPVTSNTLTIANSAPTLTAPSLQPSPLTEDDNLSFTSSPNDEDQDPVHFDVRWFLDGVLVPELNDALEIPSYATRVGDQWSVEVRANDSEDVSQWLASQTLTVGGGQVNTPPAIDSLSLTPSTPYTGDMLQLSYAFSDSDGDSEVDFEVLWYLNNAAYDFAQNSLEIPAMVTEKGQSWYAKIRVSDGNEWSSWSSSPSVVIQNSPPVTVSVDLSEDSISTTESVNVTYQMTDDDGDSPQNPQITWWRDGVQKSSLNGFTTLPASSTLKGETWTVKVAAGDGQDVSPVELTAQVTVVNSAPSATATLPVTVNSLETLTVATSFEDVDDDTVALDIAWYRNGFLEGSLNGSSTVPPSLLGPGQVWTVHVLPTDSDDLEGPVAIASITITNLEPTAVIVVETTPVWEGEQMSLTASSSTDSDGRVVESRWSWVALDGSTGTSTGTLLGLVAQSNTIITLSVIDDSGESASTTVQIATSQGPGILDFEASVKGQTVDLQWSWDGQASVEYQVLRNGVVVTTLNQTEFIDSPFLAGNISYSIRPILDGQGLIAGTSDTLVVTVEAREMAGLEPNATWGSISGIIVLLSGLAVAGYALKEERA